MSVAAEELLSPEVRLASSVLGHRPPPKAEVDWHGFVRICHLHGVIPHMLRAVATPNGTALPDEVIKQLNEHFRDNSLRSMSHVAECLRLHRRFEAANIFAVPLKGVALAQSLFGSCNARQSTDIDYWVDAKDLQKADNVLTEAGYLRERPAANFRVAQLNAYRKGNNEFNYRRSDGLLLDLHWRLHPFDGLVPLDIGRVASEAVTIRIAGTELPWLSDELLYLHLLTHGARERWSQLKWILDALQLYQRNPSHFRACAEAAGLSRIQHQVLLLGSVLLGMEELIDGLVIEPAAYRLCDDAIKAIASAEHPPNLLWWSAYFIGRPTYYARLRSNISYRREVLRTEYCTPHYGEICMLPDWALPYFWFFRPWIFLRRYAFAA